MRRGLVAARSPYGSLSAARERAGVNPMTEQYSKTSTKTAPNPPRQPRLLGLDAVRALAILGMIYMHVSPTGWLEALPFSEKPAPLAWLEGLLTGRAMSLFVFMAGISVALMTGGSRPHTGARLRLDRQRLAIRAGTLLVISLLVDQFSGANLSILEFYSLWLIALIPLLRLSPRTLLTGAAVAGLVLPLFSFVVLNYGSSWPISPFNMGRAATGLQLLIQPQDWLAKLHQFLMGGGFQTPYAIPLLLAGLALGRMDLRSSVLRRQMAWAGALFVAGSWFVSWLALGPLGGQAAIAAAMAASGPFQQPWISTLTLPPNQLYALSLPMAPFMLGVGLLLLATFLPLLDVPTWQRMLAPLTALGRMALTWYALHLVFIHQVAGTPPYAFTLFAGMAVFALVVSPLWLRMVSRGPLEWLMHRATLLVGRSRP